MGRILFERLASGAITPSASIRPLHLLWYDGAGFPYQLFAEGCLLSLVTFFIGSELRSMRVRGLHDYWGDISNWTDWPSLLGFALVAWLRYKTWSAVLDIKHKIAEDAADGSIDVLLNFQAVGWWASNEQLTLSVLALVTYLKVLHFLAGVPHISNLLHTLDRARNQLAAFIVCLAVLVFAFASAFYLALGNDLYAWRGISQSSISLLRFVLGEVDIQAIMAANPTLGTLFYLLFVFLVVLVAVSIFLAIVTNAYAEERANAIYVNLPKVLKEAYDRQKVKNKVYRAGVYHRMAAPLRAWRRWRRRRNRKPGEEGDDEYSDEEVVGSDGGSFKRSTSLGGDSVGAPAAAELSAEDKAAAAIKHMEAAKEAMEGGHLFVLNEISTQLKSLCFRQDGGDLPIRPSLHSALMELERLSSQNDQLKAKALKEGWMWDLASGQLLPSGKGRKGGGGVGEGGAAAEIDAEIKGEQAARAKRAAEREQEEEATLDALAQARNLARGGAAGPVGASAMSDSAAFAAFQRAMAADDEEDED